MFSGRGDAVREKAQTNNLLEIVGEAVFRLDTQGKILYASKRTIDLINPGGGLAGLFISEMVPFSDCLTVSQAVAQAVQGSETIRVNVRLGNRENAKWFELQVSVYGAEQSA